MGRFDAPTGVAGESQQPEQRFRASSFNAVAPPADKDLDRALTHVLKHLVQLALMLALGCASVM
jgi:hypothetical protein